MDRWVQPSRARLLLPVDVRDRVSLGAWLIGIDNRDLGTLEVRSPSPNGPPISSRATATLAAFVRAMKAAAREGA